MAAAAEQSTQSPRSPARAALPSAWTHVVRGEPDPTPSSPPPEPSDRSLPSPVESVTGSPAPPEGGEGNGNAGGARGRKLAWSLPANGSPDAGPVMGADSWPPLSGCTRASPKPSSSSSSDSLRLLPDGSPSSSQAHVIASQPPLLNLSTNTPTPNPAANHGSSGRHKPMRRGSGPSANGGPTLPLPPPSPTETPHVVHERPSGPEPSPQNGTGNSNGDHGPRGSGSTHGGSDNYRGYGGNRRGSNGGGYGSRRDHERGGHDWYQSRGFGGRDMRMQPPPPPPRGVSRPPFIGPPPPPASTPFMGPPQTVRPFVSPMRYADIPPPMFYIPAPPEPPRGVPFVAPVAPAVPPIMLVPPPDLRALLLNQIDYYFSPENLCKDTYLRQRMDEQGWVHVSLISGFNRVKLLTNNIQYILDSVRASEVVEVQGDRLRKRNDWMTWLLPKSPNQYGTSGLQSPTIPNHDALSAHLQSVGLEDGTTSHNIATGPASQELVLNRSGSGSFINQFQGNDSNNEWSTTASKESGRVNIGRSLGRSDTL